MCLILVSLVVLQVLEYKDLLLHLRYEVASLLLSLNLGDLCLLHVTEHAFFFGLEGYLLTIALDFGILSQMASFPQLPLGGLELRFFLL